MPAYPRVGDFPEALVKILLTIMEKSPEGGATMEDLKGAYQETRGLTPSNKTIYRSIRRLNLPTISKTLSALPFLVIRGKT